MDFRSAAACVVLFLPLISGCTHGPGKGASHTIGARSGADPAFALSENERALKLIAQGKVGEAMAALKAAIDADPTFAPAHNNLGELYLRQPNYYQAAWEFQIAARLTPDRPEPANNLGLVYERAGEIDKAMGWYQQASALAPNSAEYLGNLVRARIRRGDHDASVKEQLSHLVLVETRSEWSAWAREKLALWNDVRVPATHPASDAGDAPVLPDRHHPKRD